MNEYARESWKMNSYAIGIDVCLMSRENERFICENLWILFITTRDFVVNTYALGVMEFVDL